MSPRKKRPALAEPPALVLDKQEIPRVGRPPHAAPKDGLRTLKITLPVEQYAEQLLPSLVASKSRAVGA